MKHEDSKTEIAIQTFRKTDKLPARLTLRFLGACSKRDLSRLAGILSSTDSIARRMRRNGMITVVSRKYLRTLNARLKAVTSERRQRGHIK